jgi:PAS domain S-box-containing protein
MNILIVDDNNDDRKMLRYALEAHGHKVMEAVNGQDGLQTASVHKPGLIISDVLMPVMDGFQFLRNLRVSSSVPFIFYSAVYDSCNDMQLATSLGADCYLIKPKDPLKLMEEIGRIVDAGPKEGSGDIDTDAEYQKRYSQVVVSKLEDKVRELEEALAERKRMELRLQQAQEFTGQIINSIPDPIFVKDRQHRFFLINNAFCSFTGHTHEELLGKSDYDFFPMEEANEYCGKDELVFNSDRTNLNEEALTDAAGNRHFIQTRKASFIAVDGREFLIGVIRDISERKQAEEALLDKQQRLSEMTVEISLAEERERRRIAAELHDNIGQTLLLGKIKLGSLINMIPAGIDKNDYEEILMLQEQVIRAVRSLTQQLSPPILSVAGLEAALEWLGKRMEEDFGLRVAFADDRKPKPLTEDIRSIVFQACRELLINVAKHAETGSARVAVGREYDMLYLTVEDCGKGFEPAKSAVGLRDSGFGLFNIQERIKHLGGEVLLESTPGQGTRVTLRVALAKKTG